MTDASTPGVIESPSQTVSGGFGGHGLGRDGSGYGGYGDFGSWDPLSSRGWSVPPSAYRLGMWLGLASVSVFFASLGTVMATLHHGMARVWIHTPLPPILYANTAVLLASSLTLELARRSLSAGHGRRFARWLRLTLGLGLAFIGGQIAAWRQLVSKGFYLEGSPSSAFFYALTFVHGLHLLGGAIALLYLVLRVRDISHGLKKRTAVDVTTLYWHFMDALWIYLMGLILFVIA